MSVSTEAQPLNVDHIRARINTTLDRFLQAKTDPAEIKPLTASVRTFLDTGGKRLRPLMAVVGYHAAGARGQEAQAYQIAAGLEMLHSYILIHDDVIDRAEQRRGQPTAHRALAAHHASAGGKAANWFGICAAVTIGDLAHGWADELFHTAGLNRTQHTGVQPVLAAMRQEVMVGQYLDLKHTANAAATFEDALTIYRYKTAHYTVHRPLQIGAAISYADTNTMQALTAYGVPLGEAFQIRDDILGVFGDPNKTGKSNLDDLREGKHTVLVAHARQQATPTQRSRLEQIIGNPAATDADAADAREIMISTSALAHAECLINHRYLAALKTVDNGPFAPHAQALMRALAVSVTRRQS